MCIKSFLDILLPVSISPCKVISKNLTGKPHLLQRWRLQAGEVAGRWFLSLWRDRSLQSWSDGSSTTRTPRHFWEAAIPSPGGKECEASTSRKGRARYYLWGHRMCMYHSVTNFVLEKPTESIISWWQPVFLAVWPWESKLNSVSLGSLLFQRILLGVMVHTCNLSTLRDWGRRMEPNLGNLSARLCFRIRIRNSLGCGVPLDSNLRTGKKRVK